MTSPSLAPTSNAYVDSVLHLAADLKRAGTSHHIACKKLAGRPIDGLVLEHIFFRSLPSSTTGGPQFKGDYPYIALGKLARQEGVNRRTIWMAMNRLADAKLIGRELRSQNNDGKRGRYCFAWVKLEPFYKLITSKTVCEGPCDNKSHGHVIMNHNKAASPSQLPHSDTNTKIPCGLAGQGPRAEHSGLPVPGPQIARLSASSVATVRDESGVSSSLSPVASQQARPRQAGHQASGLRLEEMKAAFELRASELWPGLEDYGTGSLVNNRKHILRALEELGLSGLNGFKTLCVAALGMAKQEDELRREHGGKPLRIHPGLLHSCVDRTRDAIDLAKSEYVSADETSVRLALGLMAQQQCAVAPSAPTNSQRQVECMPKQNIPKPPAAHRKLQGAGFDESTDKEIQQFADEDQRQLVDMRAASERQAPTMSLAEAIDVVNLGEEELKRSKRSGVPLPPVRLRKLEEARAIVNQSKS